MEQVTLTINGMSCGHCVAAVKQALSRATGVQQVTSVEVGRAQVVIDEAATSPDQVAEVVTEAGYDAHPVSLS